VLQKAKRAAYIVARIIALPFTIIDWAFGLFLPY
jgi:hypothetical protein